MIEFRIWEEQHRQLEVNPEAMLALAYRQIAEVGNIFGKNPEVGEKVTTALKVLDELKALTEYDDVDAPNKDQVDVALDQELGKQKQLKPNQDAAAKRQKAILASRRARTRGERGHSWPYGG